MPIYEYECAECGHYLDALQKMSDEPLTECPECGASALTRLISAPGFRLKGSGWYETDFKKDNRRNLAGDSDKDGKAAKGDTAESGKSNSESKKDGETKKDKGKEGKDTKGSKSSGGNAAASPKSCP